VRMVQGQMVRKNAYGFHRAQKHSHQDSDCWALHHLLLTSSFFACFCVCFFKCLPRGVSWQITPRALTDGLGSKDPEESRRAFQAMMTMKKIDVAAIEAARKGEAK
jgi:hypothetical protein